MSKSDSQHETDEEQLIRLAGEGDERGLAELFGRYRKRLRQMVRLRLDRRLQGRVDPSDVLQEAYLDVAQQLPHYLCKREMSFFLWLRLVTGQRMMRLHREHLGAGMRDAGREVSLYKGALPQASSVSLAAQLLGRYTPASQAVSRAEVQIQIQTALNGMDAMDREIIALRHFEELSNAEVAEVLGLEISTASKRYIRALKRLQVVLEDIPGLIDRVRWIAPPRHDMTTIGNATMSVSSPERPSIEDLAEEFLERRRRDERPTMEDYAARYPHLAGEIREFFPVLGLVEDFKPAMGEASGSIAGSRMPGQAAGLHRLGDFRLLREVGRGGMGIVYEAEQESLGRRVALKVLRDHWLLDPKLLIRFQREAKAAARLHHTNIVPVFGVGEHAGTYFYVMQFIRGLPLDAVLKGVRQLKGTDVGPGSTPAATKPPDGLTEADLARSLATGRFESAQLVGAGSSPRGAATAAMGRDDDSSATFPGPPSLTSATDTARQYARSVARVGLQVAEALDYAHQHGILHRDIKPSNLLLDAHGAVWVTDFGLAKVASDSDLTRTGDIVGTIRYMAPERFDGRCDARSDVYALGLTLYELLAKKPAFEAEDRHALIRQVMQEEPKALRRVEPTVLRDLHTIVHRAIAKDPKDRYATAAELRDELERFLSDRPIRARPVLLPERYWRWCRRNPLLALASSAAFALTIAIAVVSSLAAYRNGRLADQLKSQRDEANQNLIQAYTSEAEARRHSRQVGQRFGALDAIARAMRLAATAGLSEAERIHLRNQAIAAMGLPDARFAWQHPLTDPKRSGFTIDPSFERYAIKRDDGTMILRRIADDRVLLELAGVPHRIHGTIGGFSPDGRYLAMKSWDQHDWLEVWDLAARRLVLTEPNISGSNTPTWSFHPDGRRLALGLGDGSIVVIDLADGHEVRRWATGFGRVASMAYNPDGSRLAVVPVSSGTLYILAAESDDGRVLARLSNPAHVFHIAWNPFRSNLLAAGIENRTIRIWDMDTGRDTATLEGDTNNGLVVAFHPDGDILAGRGWDGILRLWDVRTRQPILIMPSSWLPELHFDRDGRRLSAHGIPGLVGILEVSDQAECRSLVRATPRGPIRVRALAIDVTGRHLAASSYEGITLWDLPTGVALATLPVTALSNVQFDPTGALLTAHPLTLRWPISSSPDGHTIGPPQFLQWYQTWDGFSCSRDGRSIALAIYDGGGMVFDAENPDRRRFLPQRDTRAIALSPDGRWAVTSSHTYSSVKVWDARTGRLVHDYPESPRRGVGTFSPDGHWLSLGRADQSWELFETGTWESRMVLGNSVSTGVFSPDSATFAYETYYGTQGGAIALVELATGRELARLHDPDGAAAAQMVFSPDGTQLIAALWGRPQIRIWNLRAIRRQLANLNLDWSPSPPWGSPAPIPVPGPPPRPYRVDRGRMDDWVRSSHLKGPEQQVVDADALLNQDSGQPGVREWLARSCNDLARALIIGPESRRDPARALPLARRALALKPDGLGFLNTLGLALYRVGHYQEAMRAIERSLAANRNDSVSQDLFILALCHARQADLRPSRSYFDRAVSRLKSPGGASTQSDQELGDLRAEAEAAIRASFSLPDLPADVFAPEPVGPPDP